MSGELWIDDDDRFQPLRLIPWWQQELLKSARVMVVGAGALGNEAIKNLALLGVGHIDIIDMDTIEASNLSRSVLFRIEDCGRPKAEVAALLAQRLSESSRVEAHTANVLCDVGLGMFAAADVVLGCLDNREARLWVNRCCWRVGRPWIDAGIQEIHGVVQAFAARQAPCYECGMKDADYASINLRYSCPLLRREDLAMGRIPTTPTIASIIAAWQVQLAVKAMHGVEVPWGQAIVFNGQSDSTYRTRLPTKEDCLSHEAWHVSVNLPLGRPAQSAQEWLMAAKATLHANENPVLLLEREFVNQLTCKQCGEKRLIQRSRWRLSQEMAACSCCHAECLPELISEIAMGSELSELSLAELGVPANDWVQVRLGDKNVVVSMSDLELASSREFHRE